MNPNYFFYPLEGEIEKDENGRIASIGDPRFRSNAVA
jgi:hypothetical protein